LINFMKIISNLLSLALIIPMHALAFSVGDIPCRTYLDTTVKLDISAKFDPVLQKVIITWPRCVGTDTVCVVLDATQTNTLPTTLTKIWDINPGMPGLTDPERLACGLPVNIAPIAQDLAISTDQNIPINSNVIATDASPLTYALAVLPTNGTIAFGVTGLFTYTPNTGFVGTDSFTFTANDGSLTSAPGNVVITVSLPPVNMYVAPTSSFRPIPSLGGVYTNPDNAQIDDSSSSNPVWYDGDWAWTGFVFPGLSTVSGVEVQIRGLDTYGDGGNSTLVSLSNDGITWTPTQSTSNWTGIVTTATLIFNITDVSNLSVRLTYLGDSYSNEQAIEYIQVKVIP